MRAHPSIALPVVLVASCDAVTDEASTVAGLRRMAARGHAEASYHLGMAYQTGTGFPRDPARPLNFFRRAAERGDPLVAYKLGCLYAGQNGVLPIDAAQALRWKTAAADAGYALAQQDVALILAARGEHGAALEWLKKAAAEKPRSASIAYAAASDDAAFGRNPVNTAAYLASALAIDGGDPEQRAWLASFRARLTPDERARADALVGRYRPAPTPLTIKALSRLTAAEALVAAERPQ